MNTSIPKELFAIIIASILVAVAGKAQIIYTDIPDKTLTRYTSGPSKKFNLDLNNIPTTILKWHSYGFGWSTDEEVMHRLVAKWHKHTTRAVQLKFARASPIQRGK